MLLFVALLALASAQSSLLVEFWNNNACAAPLNASLPNLTPGTCYDLPPATTGGQVLSVRYVSLVPNVSVNATTYGGTGCVAAQVQSGTVVPLRTCIPTTATTSFRISSASIAAISALLLLLALLF